MKVQVNRNLKPENVIVDVDGYLKHIDFGIAKIIGEKRHDSAGHSVKHDLKVVTGQECSSKSNLVGRHHVIIVML